MTIPPLYRPPVPAPVRWRRGRAARDQAATEGRIARYATTVATATWARPQQSHEELTLYFGLKDPVTNATCDFSGVACRFCPRRRHARHTT